MTLITTVVCDWPNCKSRIELGDNPFPGAEEILEVRDAESKRFHFCCQEHLRNWIMGYRCPYKAPAPEPTKAPVAWPKGKP